MSLDRNFFHPSALDANGQPRWGESAMTTVAATVAVLIVALVAVLMGMA